MSIREWARSRRRSSWKGAWPDHLNVGCGYDKREGYLNIDMDRACNPDLLIKRDDYSALPSRHFRSVLASDVLEHVGRNKTLSVLLEWAALTAPGGTLDISTSSIIGVVEMMRHGSYADQYNWTRCLFGNQAHPGDFHYTGFTEKTLVTHLHAAGYQPGAITVEDGWLFKVVSEKVSDWTDLASVESLNDRGFVQEAFNVALWREPDDASLDWCLSHLAKGGGRRTVLKQLYATEERLYGVAARHGL